MTVHRSIIQETELSTGTQVYVQINGERASISVDNSEQRMGDRAMRYYDNNGYEVYKCLQCQQHFDSMMGNYCNECYVLTIIYGITGA